MGMPISKNNEEFISATERSILACGKLGIKNIVVHTGYEIGISKEQNFDENKKFFLKLLDSAEKNNVNILVENFNKMEKENLYWIDNAEDLLSFIEYVNHSLLHAVWDTGHGNMIDVAQRDSLRILNKHVYALHIQDNDSERDLHTAPFFGTLDIDSLMQGLQDINYSGYFTFEAPNIYYPKRNSKILQPSLELKIQAEKLLYEIGKYILKEYNCFEE